jgi:DNA-binding CsgD family transcriptional regulator
MIAAMGASPVTDVVREGREALAAADWDAARSAFERAEEIESTPDALDGLSEVANFEGDYDRAVELKEQAFAAYRRLGEDAAAADAARWLAFLHATYRGDYSVASGWIGRAENLLEGLDESAAHGWLILDHAPFSANAAERRQLAVSALAIARRFGDSDLEFEAIALLGEAEVALGRVAEGLKLLDQAMTGITGGEVADHKAIGEIYCRLLSACEQATEVRRAEEWIAALDRHVVWTDFVRPTCRTHYGAILITLGRWPEAEAELLAALETFEQGYRGDRAFPAVRLAELRVRQGRFEDAERLLKDHEWHPVARRASAAIAAGRGDLALAQDLAHLCLEGGDETNASCGPALELLVAVQASRGDLGGARETADRLARLADATQSRRWAAAEELASGRILAAAEDARAPAALRSALERFGELELPLEAAHVRLELARALAREGSEAAAYEARLALDAFDALGAARDRDAAANVLRSLGAGSRAGPRIRAELTKRESEVLALLAEGLANAQIAERLFISVRTAEHHVASILRKLEVRSRSEAAAYAVRASAENP